MRSWWSRSARLGVFCLRFVVRAFSRSIAQGRRGMSSSGALACRFALRLASPRRFAAALAAAAPSEDIPRLTVEVCWSTHPPQMWQLAVARVRMRRLDAAILSLRARTSRGRTKVDPDSSWPARLCWGPPRRCGAKRRPQLRTQWEGGGGCPRRRRATSDNRCVDAV